MDPQDPNTPKQPEVDHSNPFDQFFTDEETPTAPAEAQPVATMQETINELAPQVPEPTATLEPEEMPIPPAPIEQTAAPDVTPEPFQPQDPDLPTGMAAPAQSIPTPMPVTPITTRDNFIPKQNIRINGVKILIGLFLFIVMVGIGTVGMLAATGNLGGSFLGPIIQQIQKLPFIPKSAEFVIGQALAATVQVDAYHYDMSASMNMKSQQNLLGDSEAQFDFEMGGDAVFNDQGGIDKLQGNVTFRSGIPEFNGTLSANYITDSKMVYVQMGSVTGALGAFSSYLPPVNTWYSLDTSSLDSQARAALDTSITPAPDQEKLYAFFTNLMEQMFKSGELEDEVVLTGVEKMSDNTNAYHLKITPSHDTIIRFVQEFANYNNEPIDPEDVAILRESLDNWNTILVDFWIDEENYMMRKLQLVVSYTYNAAELLPAFPIVFNPEGPVVAGASKVLAESEIQEDIIDLSVVAEFGNINQTPIITIPTEHTPIEEYYSQLFESFTGMSANESLQDARNSKVKSDVMQLASGIEMYFTENNGIYPITLNSLVESQDAYLNTLPSASEERPAMCTIKANASYAYTRAADGEALIWVDLEPCVGGDTQEWYVYSTACGNSYTYIGAQPTDQNIKSAYNC